MTFDEKYNLLISCIRVKDSFYLKFLWSIIQDSEKEEIKLFHGEKIKNLAEEIGDERILDFLRRHDFFETNFVSLTIPPVIANIIQDHGVRGVKSKRPNKTSQASKKLRQEDLIVDEAGALSNISSVRGLTPNIDNDIEVAEIPAEAIEDLLIEAPTKKLKHKFKIANEEKEIKFIEDVGFGNIEGVREYIADESNNPFVCMNKTRQYVHLIAAEKGNLEMLQLLWEGYGSSLFNKGNTGLCNALHKAIKKGNLQIVKFLVEEVNIDITKKCYFSMIAKQTSLELAKKLQKSDIFEYLKSKLTSQKLDGAEKEVTLEKSVKKLKYIFKIANEEKEIKFIKDVRSGDIEGVREYIADESNNPLVCKTRFREHVHLIAAEYGHLEILKFLWENCGSEMFSRKNTASYSVLHKAVKSGNLDVVKFLVEEANIDITMECFYNAKHDKVSALFLSERSAKLEVTNYLKSKLNERNAEIIEYDDRGDNILDSHDLAGFEDIGDDVVEIIGL